MVGKTTGNVVINLTEPVFDEVVREETDLVCLILQKVKDH